MFRRLMSLTAVCSAFMSQAAFSASVVPVTFDDLPKLVKERNQAVTGAEHIASGAEARTGYLARSYLPTLRAEMGGEYFETGPYSPKTQPYGAAEAKINLFRGGRDALEEDVREAQAETAQASAVRTYLTELTDARKTYWTLIFTREMVSTLTDAVKQNEQNLAMANRRIARGLGSETDRLEFEIYRSQLQEEIESLKHADRLIEIRFAAILDLTTDTNFKTAERINHEHDENLIATAFDPLRFPEVQSLQANQKSAAAQKSHFARWWTPSLDVYGGYFLYTLRERDFLGQSFRDDTVAGVRLTFELFDGLQSKASASAFSLQAQGYEEQTKQRAKSADAQVEVAKEDLKHDHHLIHWAEDRIGQGKKYLTRTLDEYNRGVKNSLDMLGAAQKYLTFERQYAERRRDYQITKSGLLALMGQ